MITRFVRRDPPPPLSPHAATVDRLRRAFNAVRDAQEMLERLVRTGPVALRRTLPAPIGDLEWTAAALSTALLALQDPADAAISPLTDPAAVSKRTATPRS
jgi:hypothetical protein